MWLVDFVFLWLLERLLYLKEFTDVEGLELIVEILDGILYRSLVYEIFREKDYRNIVLEDSKIIES